MRCQMEFGIVIVVYVVPTYTRSLDIFNGFSHPLDIYLIERETDRHLVALHVGVHSMRSLSTGPTSLAPRIEVLGFSFGVLIE